MKNRLNSIYAKIEDIEYFIKKRDGKIMTMLEDRVYKPATRMHLISIAEQFSKLKEENELEMLAYFEKEELRGINAKIQQNKQIKSSEFRPGPSINSNRKYSKRGLK